MTIDANHTITYPWLLIGVVWLITALTAKRSLRREPLASRMFHLLFMAGTFLLLARTDWRMGPLNLRIIPSSAEIALAGLALAWLGAFFALWARFTLGNNWSASVTVKENHSLVLRGPYRLVRHPIYTGLLTAILGTALVFGETRSFLAVLLGYVAFWFKARKEEEFMIQEFGDEYRSYQSNVRQLIPFVL